MYIISFSILPELIIFHYKQIFSIMNSALHCDSDFISQSLDGETISKCWPTSKKDTVTLPTLRIFHNRWAQNIGAGDVKKTLENKIVIVTK